MIKEFCGECGNEHPRRRWEKFCDACGLRTALGVFGKTDEDNESQTLRQCVTVQVGLKNFSVCVDCIAKCPTKLLINLSAEARSRSQYELAEALEKHL